PSSATPPHKSMASRAARSSDGRPVRGRDGYWQPSPRTTPKERRGILSNASGRVISNGRALISRRRFAQGSGLAVAGLALGTACPGGGTPRPPAPAATAAGATVPTPTPAGRQPKYGGTFSFPFNFEAPHMDVHQTATALLHAWGPGAAYSRLVRFKVGPGTEHGTATPVGDLAESWTQPDDLTYIFKLRPGVKWQNIAPVNGRELVAQDVVYSFQRQIDLKTNAGFLGPITKLEAPDR